MEEILPSGRHQHLHQGLFGNDVPWNDPLVGDDFPWNDPLVGDSIKSDSIVG